MELVLRLFFSCIFLVRISSLKQNDMILVGTNEDESESQEATVDNDSEVLQKNNPFKPTHEWQEILPGQGIPRGLHVRINLETGRKEAKLLDNENEEENNQIDRDQEKYLKSLNAKFKEQLKYMKSDDGKSPEELKTESEGRKKMFRSMEEIKAELKDVLVDVETDAEIINKLKDQYFDVEKSEEEKIVILEDLEYLLHQIDNAVHFIDTDGINTIIKPGLNSSNSEVQNLILSIIGASAQSNPKVQIAFIESNIIHTILYIVQHNTRIKTQVKAVFALSCILRGFPHGQKEFTRNGGLDILRNTLDSYIGSDAKLQVKIVSLIQDLVDEQENSVGEKYKQLSEVDIKNKLADGNWCPSITNFFKVLVKFVEENVDLDYIHKIIFSVKNLLNTCETDFKKAVPSLQSIKNILNKLSAEDDEFDSFYNDLNKDVIHLITHLTAKEEL